jgi:probable rRNA maturation factor
MAITVDVQRACETASLPDDKAFHDWVSGACSHIKKADAEICIRLVDSEAMAELNQTYRQREGATNILSFEMELPDMIESNEMGDLVICAPLVQEEARQQNKPEMHHWAHLVIHGLLHLAGYDHTTDNEARAMETMEISILSDMNIPDPYQPTLPTGAN